MKVGKLVAAVAVVALVVGGYMAFFTPRAVASLALQVNPAIGLTVSGKDRIMDAEGLDAQGEALLAGLKLEGKKVDEALRLIAEELHKAGLLDPQRRIVIALSPIEDKLPQKALTALTETVRGTLDGYLKEQGLSVKVVSVEVTGELAESARKAGILPDDYVDLVEEAGSELAMKVLELQAELDIDPELFSDEFDTIAAGLLDMLEAGMTEEAALAILKGTLVTDPELEELSTIVAATIDLHDVGATAEDIMAVLALVEAQLAAGTDRELLLEEITTFTAAMVDLLEAGVKSEAALAMLKTAMEADPTLEELTTITAAMADLIEAGLTEAEALAKIETAIKADPTLEDFDDLIEGSDDD
ncbi:MAG: hypothetical protein AB1492_00095 [Bacillota bacterium]